MVNLSSTISGFSALVGWPTTQFFLTMLLFCAVKVPQAPYDTSDGIEPIPSEQDALIALCASTLLSLRMAHLIAANMQCYATYKRETIDLKLEQFLTFGAVIGQVYIFVTAASFLTHVELYTRDQQMSAEFIEFKNWIQAEVVIFGAQLAANVTYMFVRSFTQQSSDFTPNDDSDRKFDAETDFLASQLVYCGWFTTSFTGLALLVYVDAFRTDQDSAKYITGWMLPVQSMQVFAILFMIFGTKTSNPMKNKAEQENEEESAGSCGILLECLFDCFVGCAACLGGIAMVIAMIIGYISMVLLPFIQLFQIRQTNESLFTSVLWINFWLQSSSLFMFLFYYAALGFTTKSWDPESSERQIGSGKIRIGTQVDQNEDIYALLLASTFKIEKLEEHRWEAICNDQMTQQMLDNAFTVKYGQRPVLSKQTWFQVEKEKEIVQQPASVEPEQEGSSLKEPLLSDDAKGEQQSVPIDTTIQANEEQENPVEDTVDPATNEDKETDEFMQAAREEFFANKLTISRSNVRKSNYFVQTIVCFFIQIALCVLLCKEMFTSRDEDGMLVLALFPPSAGIVFARFACGVILHMQLQTELISGLKNMKLVLNHNYRFENPHIAFCAGFLQAFSIFVLELVNFVVILTSASYLDVVMNFMALAVISEFDDAFYVALGTDPAKDIITNPAFADLYKITRTCSENYKPKKDEAFEDDTVPENQQTTISYFVTYKNEWRFLNGVYRVMRVVQVSLWFYFVPFVALVGSYAVPYALSA